MHVESKRAGDPGKTLAENVRNAEIQNEDVIRSLDNPLQPAGADRGDMQAPLACCLGRR